MRNSDQHSTEKIVVRGTDSVRVALEAIRLNGLLGVFVVDEKGVLIGSVTDGDARLEVLKGLNLDVSVRSIMNPKPRVVKKSHGSEEIYRLMREYSILMVPRVNEEGVLVDYYHFFEISDELFSKTNDMVKSSRSSGEEKFNTGEMIAVIGGAGYIGSVLVRKLLEAGKRVRVLDSLLYGGYSVEELKTNDQFELIRGDVRDTETVLSALRGVDSVVHLGEIVGDPACAVNDSFTLDVNFLATKNLVEMCVLNKIPRMVFASSCSVYGAGSQVFNEESDLNPVSLYARCKIQSEKVIMSFFDKKNFFPTILRLATVYGPSFRPRFDLVVNLLTAKALIDQEITIYGGNQWRPFIGVDDVTRAIMMCLVKPKQVVGGEIFNTGDRDLNYQIIDIGRKINEKFPAARLAINKKSDDERNYLVDFNKIEHQLDFRCTTDLEQGITGIAEMIKRLELKSYRDRRFHNLLTLS
jgi:nucleoside-diphosphate-sugar epimerase